MMENDDTRLIIDGVKYLTPEEFAVRIGCSVKTLYRYVKAGLDAPTRLYGRTFFPEDRVEAAQEWRAASRSRSKKKPTVRQAAD